MSRSLRAMIIAVTALTVSMAGSSWGQDCPRADVNDDCVVDFGDLRIVAERWLDDSCVAPACRADIDGVAGVDEGDFAVLAGQWGDQGDATITLVINEFMADNKDFFVDNFGEDDDWIEIYNYGSRPVDIGGMYMTDELGSDELWRIPDTATEQTTIPAGGYLVIWADNDTSPTQGVLHVGFGLRAGGGEDVVLLDADRNVVDSILGFGPQTENNSYGRLPDAGTQLTTFVPDTENPPTPGRSNGGRSPDDDILITEIMYHPFNVAHPMWEDLGEEYIELYNRGFSAVNLANWQIADGVDFTFPAVSIGPGEYLVVAADVETFAAKYPGVTNVVGGWTGRLSNSGEDIELANAMGRLIDKVPYADEGEWALRMLGPVDNSHRGWTWSDGHDGDGMSLEVISMSMPNEYGQNWAVSLTSQGTPGMENSATGVLPETVSLVSTGSVWRYLDDGSNQDTAWRGSVFDDGTWASGPSELGYGDSSATVVGFGSNANNKYVTTYFRHSFNVADASQIGSLRVRILRDDGAVVYLNGQEIVRSNMSSGTIDYLTLAASGVSGAAETVFHEYIVNPAILNSGDNVLAVEIHQSLVTSSDISFDLILQATLKSDQEPVQDIAPMIIGAKHRPIIPRSSDPVTVTARIIDEEAGGFGATVYYRVDGQSVFSPVVMSDDGLNGDAAAGDSVFTAQIPPLAAGSVVEFYVEASDLGGNLRTWPAPVEVDSALEQRCNALYQVDDSYDPDAEWTPGSQPIYYIIMKDAERAELAQIGSTGGEANSNAQMNATFISRDGVDIKARYLVGVRNRGHGSRTANPNNYRVNFNSDRDWKDVFAINLNAQYSWVQIAGSAVFQRSGLPIGDATAVQVRVNGNDLAGTGSRTYGSYAHVEVLNSEWAEEHFPNDSSGNMYKCMRLDNDYPYQADLLYRGTDPDPYRLVYFKNINASQDDWTDLVDLTYVLSNNTPDDIYMDEVNRVMNVDLFVRALALNTMLDNTETTLANGVGDDYYLYHGTVDTRFLMIQHDLDSVLRSPSSPTAPIFEFMSIAALNRLISHPSVAPRYYAHLKDLIETALSEEEVGLLLDNLLGDFVPAAVIDSMKSFTATRNAHVLSLIPSELTVESNLLQVGDYYETGNSEVALSGSANAINTRSVTVNGLVADWSPIDGQWLIGEGAGGANEEVVVPRGSTWKYLDNGSNQGTAWYAPGFDDRTWSSGPSQLGYGGNGEVTTVGFGSNSSSKYITTYFRQTFNVDDASKYTNLRLSVVRDDGAVVYLNGNEVARSNMPAGAFTYLTTASNTAGGTDETTFFEYAVNSALLNSGTNVLAVEIHQAGGNSSDLSFNLELTGQTSAGPVENGVPINPGITRITVNAFDGPGGTGNVLDSKWIDFWLNSNVPTDISGTLTQDTTLNAASGPYKVSADLIVPPGVTLTITPATTVFFDPGTQLTVQGRLVAEGAENELIYFADTPTLAGKWNGIRFTDTPEDNFVSYAVVNNAESTSGSIGLINSNAVLDHLQWAGSKRRLVFTNNSSIIVQNCIFPDRFGPDEGPVSGDDNTVESINGSGIPLEGHCIIRNNIFGTDKGHNDVIDFSGPTRTDSTPSRPILQVLDNVFMGTGDEMLDLGGDAYIEGNVFMHVHKDVYNTGTGESNTISTGDGPVNSVITVVRNIFYDIDHCVDLKNDTYMFFEYNTVVGISEDEPGTQYAPIVFLIPNRNPEGKGAYLNGNIFQDIPERIFERVDESDSGDPTFMTDLEMHNCLIPPERADDVVGQRAGTIMDLGVGNFTADPLFVDYLGDFHLMPGSVAIGGGVLGEDLGAYVPAGAIISSVPGPVTNLTEATLRVCKEIISAKLDFCRYMGYGR